MTWRQWLSELSWWLSQLIQRLTELILWLTELGQRVSELSQCLPAWLTEVCGARLSD